MRVLLQNVETKAFLTSEGEWTYDIDAARNFGISTEAYQFGLRAGCERFRVVLHFPEKRELICFSGQASAMASASALAYEV